MATTADSAIRLPLLPTQRRLLAAVRSGLYDVLIWVGSIRGGKGVGSAVAMIDAAVRACRAGVGVEQNNYILAGVTQSSFGSNNGAYLYEAAKRWGLDWRFRGSGGNLRSHYELGPGVARFYVAGAKEKTAYETIRGLTARAAWIDEATLIDEHFFQTTFERCSYGDSFIIATSNTGTPHSWLKTVWIDGAPDTTLSLGSDFYENSYYDDARRKRLLAMDPRSANYKRAILNMWVPEEGLVYPIESRSIVKTADVPPRGTIVVDPGVGSITAALLFAETGPGEWLALDEYYYDGDKLGRLTDEQHLSRILAKGWQPNRIVIDPSGAAFRQVCLARGLTPSYAKNELDIGVQITNNALYAGKLRIHERCQNLLSEAAGLYWNERLSMPEVGPDHALDCLRYGAHDKFPTSYAFMVK